MSTMVLYLNELIVFIFPKTLFKYKVISWHVYRVLASRREHVVKLCRLLLQLSMIATIIWAAGHHAVALRPPSKVLYLLVDGRVRAALFGWVAFGAPDSHGLPRVQIETIPDATAAFTKLDEGSTSISTMRHSYWSHFLIETVRTEDHATHRVWIGKEIRKASSWVLQEGVASFSTINLGVVSRHLGVVCNDPWVKFIGAMRVSLAVGVPRGLLSCSMMQEVWKALVTFPILTLSKLDWIYLNSWSLIRLSTFYLSESTYSAAAPSHHVDWLERIPHVIAWCVIQWPPLHVLGEPEYLLSYASPHAHIGSTPTDMWLPSWVAGGAPSIHHVVIIGHGVSCERLVRDRLVLDDADVLHKNTGHGEAIRVGWLVAILLTRTWSPTLLSIWGEVLLVRGSGLVQLLRSLEWRD
jgi:hypothetical protein